MNMHTTVEELLHVIFCAVYVVSKESRWLVLPRTYCVFNDANVHIVEFCSVLNFNHLLQSACQKKTHVVK
jgi:hypothetical protein